VGGLIGIGALAGCSGSGGGGTADSAETDSTADEDEGGSETGDGTEGETDPAEETNETGDGTEEGTEDSTTETSDTGDQNLDQYEDDEPEMEARYEEERQDQITFNWMEFENPEEQIPQENYSLEDFPALEVLQYDNDGEGNNAYNPENETVYLGWLEKNNFDGKMTLDVAVIYEWGDSIEDSDLHAEISPRSADEPEANIEGILTEVVEGYNEVSDNMEEEYRELL
jgi:hypothetical protein